MNDGRDGRTLPPQYREQHRTIFISEDKENGTDELAAAIDSLSMDNGAELKRPEPMSHRTIVEALELFVDPDYRRDMCFSCCCLREIQQLESLVRQYPDDQLIQCIDEEDNAGALFAALE